MIVKFYAVLKLNGLLVIVSEIHKTVNVDEGKYLILVTAEAEPRPSGTASAGFPFPTQIESTLDDMRTELMPPSSAASDCPSPMSTV